MGPPFASPFQPAPESSSAPDRQPAEHVTVLLVEDNSTDVLVIREVLERCGLKFVLQVAPTGQDALPYLEGRVGERPTLVLLDLNVPKITGIELLEIIRSNHSCERIPVIIITSSHAESDRAAAQRLGANAYFRKPADLDAYQELAELVKGVTRAAQELE
jgi:two-component system, chemotaxis family, response regulator Rcp1